MSLRLRLALASLVMLVTLGGLGIFLLSSVSHSEVSQVDQELRSSFPVTRSLRGSQPPPAPPRTSTPSQFSASTVSAFYIAYVTSGSRTVFSTPLGANGVSPALPRIVSTSSNPTIVTIGSTKGSLTWRAMLLRRQGEAGALLVAVPLDRVAQTLTSLRWTLLIAGLIVLAVIAAVGMWITRLGLRPISEVTEVASAIASGDRSRRMRDMKAGTEAASLATAFNAMRDEQLALESRLRQFVADASHELRSPVAAILGITELWRRGELRGQTSSEEAMRRIGQAGDQMGRLIDELLVLARLDEGQGVLPAEVNVTLLVRETIEPAISIDPSRRVIVDLQSDVISVADDAALRRVVSNLVTNVVRHTPSTSTLTVRLSANDETVYISVSDEGPGMTSEQVTKAFDRFWQASASRTRAGVGLGLAIVRGIVHAHGGTVTLESSPQTGTLVTIQLPRVPPREVDAGV